MDNKPEVSWGWLLNLFQSILIFLVALDFNFLAQGTSEIFCGIEETMLNQPTMILPSASQELMPAHAHLLLHLQASFPHPIWYRRQHIAVVVDSPCTKSTWQSPRHFGNMAVIDAAMSAFHVSAKLALTGSCWKLLLFFSCFAINITQSCQCASWSW